MSKTLFFLALFFSCGKILSQSVEGEESEVTFSTCKKEDVKQNSKCFPIKLSQIISEELQYPKEALEKNIQGKVVIKFIITSDSLINSAQIVSSPDERLSNEALRIFSNINNYIKERGIKILPARKNAVNLNSYYRLPIVFNTGVENSPKKETEKEYVLATYIDPEETVQFRKNYWGIMKIYHLYGNSEKLITELDSDNFTEEQKKYMFLLKLAMAKPQTLINYGKVNGENVEVYYDNYESLENNNKTFIKVYTTEDKINPINTYNSFEQLFNSQYSFLLVK